MATKPKPILPRPAPRLYLATPQLADPSAMVAALPVLLKSADIAAVLLRLAPSDERDTIKRAKAIAPIVQNAGAALLLDGHFEIVARAGSDGANINGVDQIEDALSALKPDRILGVSGLNTRHDSMVAGDAGADYVLFGEPDENGERPSPDAIAERLHWWAELFEPPCVGYATTLEEAGLFVDAGADFILVDDLIWQDSRGPNEALVDVTKTIFTHFKRASSTPAPA